MILMTLPVQVTLDARFHLMLGYMNLLEHLRSADPARLLSCRSARLFSRRASSPCRTSVIDAAMLDGCGVPRMLCYAGLGPMNKSGLVCVLLLSFLDAWNMVEQPIALFARSFEQYPISVALAYTPPSETSVQLVCCILVVLPALFLFTLLQPRAGGRHRFSGGEVI